MISYVIWGFFLPPKSEISSNQCTRSHNQALEVTPNGPRRRLWGLALPICKSSRPLHTRAETTMWEERWPALLREQSQGGLKVKGPAGGCHPPTPPGGLGADPVQQLGQLLSTSVTATASRRRGSSEERAPGQAKATGEVQLQYHRPPGPDPPGQGHPQLQTIPRLPSESPELRLSTHLSQGPRRGRKALGLE